MLPIDHDKAAAETAALIARSGRAASEAALKRWCDAHPTARCEHCLGLGAFVDRGGDRRRFDPHDFDADAGDVFIASCPRCRGFGYVRVDPAEAARLEREQLKAQRASYAAHRAAVCARIGWTTEGFDAIARRRIRSGHLRPTPAQWLAAARELAEAFGVAP